MSKKPFLGFVLLTHEKPAQILRLIERLNFMFDDPPIACHHDFSKCELPLDEIPQNVSFVKQYVETAWGDWSLVDATLKGIDILYSRDDAPEWFILLSGRDYPIKPADQIIKDIKDSDCDAHMSVLKLVESELESEIEKRAFKKYHKLEFRYPSLIHLLQSIRFLKWWRKDIYLKRSMFTEWVIPFSNEFNCFYGSQWFYANQKAASEILKFYKSDFRVQFYYKRVHAPDESYFHTVLGNCKELKVCNKNWRHVNWAPGSSHPIELSMDDLETLIQSDDHFARKFNMDKYPEILDRLDEHIGYVDKTRARN
ncbi:beta-1,6-N-acetylglucosaminyltransferase [Rhodohalobacter sp. 614A]|uniref:beta-1,6-N-acetylglucosaminyltransferase n=1 Tax=Rhodohalobacter sp. 614A TaxID=2908649 RepID=UPI001F40E977|nr:beta-1,6-N-acetylglucosaminyltransferase [Rhodohalobacter sp. 614A]